MTVWPLKIANAEAIVRGICYYHHVKSNGVLKPQAYRSPPDMDEVSVMRADWIGAHRCKQHAKDLEDLNANKIYKGLAVLSARQITTSGADLRDTRNVFDGHADIIHGIVIRKGDPPPAADLKVLHDREKSLAKLAEYYPDPDTGGESWTGPPLRYKS